MSVYRGRFAPTPTGPLHFGSLFAAVISYLEAKKVHGDWLLRIEDIDPPREQPGAAAAILNTLEQHGLFWDETETYQSQNAERYLANLNTLAEQDRLYWCQCSRKSLSEFKVYPGFCRPYRQQRPDSAIRFIIESEQDQFTDAYQGTQSAQLREQYGDVVLRRRDALFAYQLAVVCDDIASEITHVIRGIDLLESTFWQRELYRAFSTPVVQYGHFPVLHAYGSNQKLSKQNLAKAVNDKHPESNLQAAFNLLGLTIDTDKPEHMLRQAIELWQPAPLLNRANIEVLVPA